MLEVQERIVAVETAQELPNLDGYHCAETPFQVPTRMTPVDLVPVARPQPRARHFKTNATLGLAYVSAWCLMD